MSQWVASWVEDLSKPNAETGMALCPFAKKAWDAGDVKVVETQDLWSAVHQEVETFGQHKVVVCARDGFEESYEELEAACTALNRWFAFKGMDIWLLASHMDKTLVFVQRLSELVLASRALEKLGYYAGYADEDYQRLIAQRDAVAQGVRL